MKMKKILVLLCIFMVMVQGVALAKKWVPISKYKLEYPMYISGVYLEGQNITEPRAKKTTHFEVESAGIILIDRGAGFFVNVAILNRPNSQYYVKITYPNPSDPDNPLINDMPFDPTIEGMSLSSPDVIDGLKGYANYEIVIEVFKDQESMELIETIRQKVRSYVDTQGDEVLIFKKILKTMKR